jgi:hypothetical protein
MKNTEVQNYMRNMNTAVKNICKNTLEYNLMRNMDAAVNKYLKNAEFYRYCTRGIAVKNNINKTEVHRYFT